MKTGIISVVLSILLGATSAAVSAQPGAPGAERFVLTGMVVWSGNEGVAWLQEPDLTRNEMVALRIGQSVGPWKLTRFLDNGIELEGPAGKVLIPLHNAGGGGTAVAAGAPAGPAAAPAGATLPRDDASRGRHPAGPGEPGARIRGGVQSPRGERERVHRGVQQSAGGESAAAGRECAGPAPRGGARRRQPGRAWSGHVVGRQVLRRRQWWCCGAVGRIRT